MKPYLVFARKYRPLTFDQVIGQKAVVQTLKNAIIQNRIGHAYLFSGMRGVGKTTVARILAKALNCENGPTPNPCNKCQFCVSINEDRAVDVLEIDGASNRGIDEVRSLREGIQYRPIQSRYRVIIIDEVHMLTNEAFNALLKTLEEPPHHTIFIFATTEFHKVPATILSRCQHFEFRRISNKDIVDHLKYIAEKEGIKISSASINLIAQKAEGSLRDAESLLDQVVAFSGEEVKDEDVKEILGIMDREILISVVDAIAEGDSRRIFPLIDEIINHGYDLRYFYRELIEFLRNLLLIKTAPESRELLEIGDEELVNIKKLAEKIGEEDIFRYLSLLQQSDTGLKYSSHPRIFLETVLLRLTHLKKLVPLTDIIEELEKLKENIPLLLQTKEEGIEGKEIKKEIEAEDKQIMEREVLHLDEKEKREEAALGNEEFYKKFLNELQVEKAPLAAIVSQSDLFELKNNKLLIGFTPGKVLFINKAKREIETLRKIANRILNREVKVEVVEQEVKEEDRFIEEEKKEEKNKDYERILNNSTVKYFMDLFKAEIISVESIKNKERI
ncbi:DNA polymerase III subunit gamma/tau [Candidatus Aminicenantes bacterium AC-335-B20]|jgi:DNA polymerase-3 subunit gamma/tau|nr:DNA polymerase III subunit gamma/tau [SCandidatus Aminicenantes bacterium Aminicenantia_JdfR_composite]MCP2598891.1 DNA polymerase III subunit gamma/tau [Candidatus Aminicenantes bacterium AC-335-B20]